MCKDSEMQENILAEATAEGFGLARTLDESEGQRCERVLGERGQASPGHPGVRFLVRGGVHVNPGVIFSRRRLDVEPGNVGTTGLLWGARQTPTGMWVRKRRPQLCPWQWYWRLGAGLDWDPGTVNGRICQVIHLQILKNYIIFHTTGFTKLLL